MATSSTAETVEVFSKTAEHFLQGVYHKQLSGEIFGDTLKNAQLLDAMLPHEQEYAKRILAQEQELTKKITDRYTARLKAVTAKNRTPEQKSLMAAYNLVSERPLVTVLTLGFNLFSNMDAEQKAVRRDANEIASEMGYAPNEARRWLQRKLIRNVFAV